MSLSLIRRLASGFSRGYTAFLKGAFATQHLDTGNKIAGAVILLFVIGIPVVFATAWAYNAWEDLTFHRLTPAEHLTRAKAACGTGTSCSDIDEAFRQLQEIPTSAREYAEASEYLKEIRQQKESTEEAAERKEQEKAQDARDRAERNFSGQAQDIFDCDTSTRDGAIVSFDGGTTWWKDDGRCTGILEKRAEEAQRKRDEEAKPDSYRSKTIRVDTDMDSFWLPDEERTCQTFPDAKGRVATVSCDANAHAIHNIPVDFWGGVDRNTISDWKCRREKDLFADHFVCRAID